MSLALCLAVVAALSVPIVTPEQRMFGSDKGPIRAVVSLGGLGLTLGIFTALGTLLGYYLDERWNTTPWLTLTGILLGMAAGFFEVITMVRRVERQDPRGRGGHGGAAPHRDR